MLRRRPIRVVKLYAAIASVGLATLAALATLVGFAGVGSAAPAKKPTSNPHGVLVARDGLTLKVFTDAKCSVGKGVFTAKSTRYGAKLLVQIKPFHGFGHYDLEAGTETGPYVSTFAEFTDPSGHDFASNFAPPYRVASGGAIQFSQNGQLIGVGFQPTFNASGSEAVIFTGVMKCHYA